MIATSNDGSMQVPVARLQAKPVGAAPRAARPIRLVRGPRSGTEKIVAVGASTGGTEAIRELLERLPPESPAFFITQHMPPGFTHSFAQRLNGLAGYA